MKVFYPENATWELDLFKYDIFHGLDVEWQFYSTINELVCPEILVISSNMCSFAEIEGVLQSCNPSIIFHLSDEYCNPEWLNLAKYTKLLFRQYNGWETDIIQIPCSYVTHSFSAYSLDIVRKSITERSCNWAFVGQIKSDRAHMCSVFSGIVNSCVITSINSWQINSQPASPCEIYGDAIFAPIGRGNISLDCSRVYEAIVSGAIPVIVASQTEVDVTFRYNGMKPFIIVADTWEDAKVLCETLLLDKNQIQDMQNANVKWWKYQITKIQVKILQN